MTPRLSSPRPGHGLLYYYKQNLSKAVNVLIPSNPRISINSPSNYKPSTLQNILKNYVLIIFLKNLLTIAAGS